MTASAARMILVVDDNAGLSALVEKYLRRDGFRTDRVTDGAGALQWLGRQSADLLLISLKLPDMTAEEVIQQLDDRGQRVRFVVMASHGDERQAALMMKRGAIDYLMKDQTLLELLPAVVKQAMLLLTTEAEYEQLRRRHEKILEAAGEGICGLDLDGCITFANPAAQRILGYGADDLLGEDFATLAERPLDGTRGYIREALAANSSFRRHDLLFWRKDGSCFPIEFTRTPIRDESGQVGSVIIFKDDTKRREAEEKARHSQKLEAVGQLAGGVAHDFNNLLTVVSGYSELLATNDSLDQRAQEAVAEIQRAAERAIAVTRKLLAFSRKGMVEPRRLDLNVVITEIAKLIHRLIGEDIVLSTLLMPGPAYVIADPGQLEVAIVNLAINARDAMPRGGKLAITTSRGRVDAPAVNSKSKLKPGPCIVLTVSDTGVGMDADTRERIFEPFFTTKEPGRGTGLGLATVYGIVDQSGGQIEVHSEPNRGTTFRILLPTAHGAAESPAETAADGPLNGEETILLVEDEQSVRELTGKFLKEFGYRVLEAHNGIEAIRLAKSTRQPIHLVLTDVVMPEMNGPELAKQLALHRPKTRVLFMSGYSGESDPRGLLHRDEAFVAKPFTKETLGRKIRAVLDQEKLAKPLAAGSGTR
jgi:two-component system, cell cycle sensor histidine kinase and response regulator CckA